MLKLETDTHYESIINDLVNEIYSKFKSDQKSLLKLEPHKVNISKFTSYALNSSNYLVIPLNELIKFIVDRVDDGCFERISFIFKVVKNEEVEIHEDEIIKYLITNDKNDLWLHLLRTIWLRIIIMAGKDSRKSFLSIDNTLEFNSHLKNGGLAAYIYIINYISNIHICQTESFDAIKTIISNKEIVNWNMIDTSIIEEQYKIDHHFLNSLINNLKLGKFLDILDIFKKHREDILNAVMNKKVGIGTENLATEFAMWWKIKLLNPQELLDLNETLISSQLKLMVLNTERDYSKGTSNYLNSGGLKQLKEEIKTIKNNIVKLDDRIRSIDMSDLDTYPDWVEKIPGPESFVNFLKEKYDLKIDISLFGFESSVNDIKEIKETKINLKEKLKIIDKVIRESIIGQDQNISPLTSVIKRWFVGLRSNKPVGSFLFVGPTGVGKTETAKILADYLFDANLITLDMSEYQNSIDVSRIIGIAPGYVGYEEGGGLLEKVKDQPKSVILLDEIEKAHPKVFDLFLQLLDEGRLTDNKGQVVSFKECLIVATSNACNDLIEEYQMKFNNSNEIQRKEIIQILHKTGSFRKEFLARFTDILKFKSLDVNTLGKIFNQKLDLELLHFENLKDFSRNIVIELSDINRIKIQNHIISDIDKSLGAREIQRVIQERITNKILDTIVELELSNNLEEGDLLFNLVYNGSEIEVVGEVIENKEIGTMKVVTEFNKKFQELFSTDNFDSVDYSKTEIKYINDGDHYVPGNDKDFRKVIFTKGKLVEISSKDFENLFNRFRHINCTITMETLDSRSYMLGDRYGWEAVELLDDGRVAVWFRWWKESPSFQNIIIKKEKT